jgi:hypothetical protein
MGAVTHTPGRAASAPESTRRARADALRSLVIWVFIVCAVSTVIAGLLPSTGWSAGVKIIILGGLLAGGLASSIRSLQRGFLPARFDVREGRSFTAPVGRRLGHQIATILFTVAASAILVSLTKDSTGFGRAAFVLYWPFGLVAAFIALTIFNVIPILRGRPGVDLTPEALVYRQPLGDLIIPWPALAAEATVTITRADLQSSAVLTVGRPDLVRRRGLVSASFRIPVALLQIDPLVLAGTIRYYLQNPDRRAQIGTLTEHEHLLAELSLS